MIDPQGLLAGSGAFLGCTMAGAGALKLCLSGAHAVGRIPAALERSAEAAERQAKVAEESASLAKTLYDLREGQEQIRLTMSSIAASVQELPCTRAGEGLTAPTKCEEA